MDFRGVFKFLEACMSIACVALYCCGTTNTNSVIPLKLYHHPLNESEIKSYDFDEQELDFHLVDLNVQLLGTITFGAYVIYSSALTICYLLGEDSHLRQTSFEMILDSVGACMFLATGSLIVITYESLPNYAIMSSTTKGNAWSLGILAIFTGITHALDAMWVLYNRLYHCIKNRKTQSQ